MKLTKTRVTIAVLGTVAMTACSPGVALKKLDAADVNVVSKNIQTPQARRLVNVPLEAKSGGKSVAAECRLDTPYYTAKFAAPANLKLPDYGANTPALLIECENPAGKGSRRIEPVNKQSQNATATGAALFGVVGAMVAASASKENDSDHFYHAINIKLK